MHKKLESLEKLVAQGGFSDIELQRLGNDIDTLYQRLSTREYVEKDFSHKNRFHIKEKTLEFFSYISSYAKSGKTFAQILQQLDINQYDKVVDLCSGWSPKVVLGYYYSSYTKEVVLIDLKKESLLQNKNFMSLFHPKFCIECECFDILSSISQEQYPFIIGNHLIDDLILFDFCTQNNLPTEEIYEKESIFIDYWNKILESGGVFQDQSLTKIARVLDRLLLKGGVIVLSQYQSMFERLLELEEVTKYNKNALFRLKNILIGKYGYEDKSGILKEVLRGAGWSFGAEDCIILKK